MNTPPYLVACDLPAELAALLTQVPRGRVTTYGALARSLGDVSAARWVGEYLLHHEHRARCPCHRVVRANGEPGRTIDGDADDKLARLRREGVCVSDGRVDVSQPFTGFRTSAPLTSLHDFQQTVPSRLTLHPFRGRIEFVAAIDVAYVSPSEAVAALVLVDADTLETVWSHTVHAAARFPYIPGYLTFRELPAMLAVWDAATSAERTADVVLIDGNGFLHPRRAGIACGFGLIADVPTIGVGKKLLCGQADLDGMTVVEERPVLHNGELVGVAMKCRSSSKPLFVSPGNQIDFSGAADLVRRLFANHRLPEPLHRADRLSKETARA